MADENGRVEVRELGPDDWKAKRDLRLAALADAPEAFGGSYADSAKRTQEQWRSWPGGVVYATYLDGDPVGIAGGCSAPDHVGGEPMVIAMWVAPAARGRRVAARLLDALADWARADGAAALHLEIKPHNTAARRSYEHFGFVVCDEPTWEPGNVAMRLPLSRPRS